MNFEFTEEQKQLRSRVEELVEKDIEPLLARYPQDQPLPREACCKIMEITKPLGFLAARVPIQDGGTGLGAVGLGIGAETMPEEAFEIPFGNDQIALRVSLGGSDELKARILPPLLRGEKLAAGCTTEPNVGSDPTAIETRAVLVGDAYIINGTKVWITNGVVADILLVMASVGRDEQGKNKVTLFIVEKDASSFQARDLSRLGMRQNNLSEVVFQDCRVPRENMLVEAAGHAHGLLMTTWVSSRPLNGLRLVNVSRKALEASIKFARERGKAMTGSQSVQAMMAEMATLIEASRLLCYQALSLADKGVWCPKESSMAKFFASQSALRVTEMAMQIHGVHGLSRDFRVEKLFRDARTITFAAGTIEIQKLIVGRELLGARAFAQRVNSLN